MLTIEELIEALACCTDPSQRSKLIDELFWASLIRGMASGTSSWGRLFADIRGWTKGGGDNAEEEQIRITSEEAQALVEAVIGSVGES